MCKRLKLISVSEDNKWRIPMASGVFAFTLGLSCFGVAIKLSEYEESPNLPPMLAGVPILVAGISGMVGGRMRKNCMISLHLVFCIISGVLGLHLSFIFLGREAKSREIYKAKCQSQFKGSYYCHRYAATVGMTVLAILPFTLTPLGILSYAVTRRLTSRYNVNDEEEENSSSLDQHGEPESAVSKMDGRPLSRILDTESAESKHTGKLTQKNNNECDNTLPPSSYREATRLVPHVQPYQWPITQWPSSQLSGKINFGNHGLQKQLSNEECSQNQAKTGKQGSCSQPPPNNVARKDNFVADQSPRDRQSSEQRNQPPRNQRHTNQDPRKHPPPNLLQERQVSRNHPRSNQALCNQSTNKQAVINQESTHLGSRNQAPSNHPTSVQKCPITVPSNHLRSIQPSQNRNARKPQPRKCSRVIHPPVSHRLSNQIPRNYYSNKHSTSNQVSSNETQRSHTPNKQAPMSNQSNQVSSTYKPSTGDQQRRSNQPLSNQASRDNVPQSQARYYPYMPRNHPLRNQVPSNQAPRSHMTSNIPAADCMVTPETKKN